MKVFLTDSEVIELAYDALDMNCPDPDKVHDIAMKMDMVYSEEMDMYEDIEDVYIRMLRNRLTNCGKGGFKTKSLAELEAIYTATFGIFPPEGKTREHFILVFEREIKFGREIKPAIKWNT
jgi:hypothetical protein